MLASTCALSPRDTTRLVFLPFKSIHLSLQLSLWLIVLIIGNLSNPVTPKIVGYRLTYYEWPIHIHTL